MKIMLMVLTGLMLSSQVMPADTITAPSNEPVILVTPQAMKEALLAQLSATQVSSLDRNAFRKRWVLERKIARIRGGMLDLFFVYQAHLKNSEAFRAAGDLSKANEIAAMAMNMSAQAMHAQSDEEAAYLESVRIAKTMTQAPRQGSAAAP
jgi:hypothetical protein